MQAVWSEAVASFCCFRGWGGTAGRLGAQVVRGWTGRPTGGQVHALKNGGGAGGNYVFRRFLANFGV